MAQKKKITNKKERDYTNFYIALAVIVFIGIIWFSILGNNITTKNYDDVAQCITSSGLKMYGTEWCPHCKEQKKLFGDSFKYIDYTDCDLDRSSCIAEGIQGYPTWKFEGKSYPGKQDIEFLAQLSNCSSAY